MDTYDLLKQHCEQWDSYPCNLLNPCQRAEIRNSYRLLLGARKARLFDEKQEEIHIIEQSDTLDGMLSIPIHQFMELLSQDLMAYQGIVNKC